jgi:hypothetical protein
MRSERPSVFEVLVRRYHRWNLPVDGDEFARRRESGKGVTKLGPANGSGRGMRLFDMEANPRIWRQPRAIALSRLETTVQVFQMCRKTPCSNIFPRRSSGNQPRTLTEDRRGRSPLYFPAGNFCEPAHILRPSLLRGIQTLAPTIRFFSPAPHPSGGRTMHRTLVVTDRSLWARLQPVGGYRPGARIRPHTKF